MSPLRIAQLPPRERQVAEIVQARGEASAADICAALDDGISNAAVRSMLARIEAKGLLRRRKAGRANVYRAVESEPAVQQAALRQLCEDYFDGSLALLCVNLSALIASERSPSTSRAGPCRTGSTPDEPAVKPDAARAGIC